MFKILKWILLCCVTGILAAFLGVFTSLGVAKYISKPTKFLIAGSVVYIFIFAIGIMIISKVLKKYKSNTYKITTYTVGSLIIIALALSLLLPLKDEQRAPLAVKGQQYWELPSGSKIAYVHLKGDKSLSQPPIIFLHGGPGVADMAGDSGYFGQLTKSGFDVYVYDEVGTGHSSRLEDPRDYTIQRDVKDLEFIREQIGVDKLILIGHSYGGEIAAHYMAEYGEHVAKAVFISPGAINPKDTSGGNLLMRLSSKEKKKLFMSMLNPRVLMAYSLLQVNPIAARNFTGDREMDGRFDIVYKYSEPALHARGKRYDSQLSGLGFYAHQTPQSAIAKPKPDIREALTKLDTPALIMKGDSDYLSWSSGVDYKKALSNSNLVYISEAGHNLYQDRPKLVMEILRAYLTDSKLPVKAYQGEGVPKDYEGVN